MTEEIKTSQTSEASRQPAGASVAQATANTGGASVNGRPERKPLISWAALLDEAVKKPGFIHEAYSRFHNYSLGNQLLALFQCFERGVQPGPLATWPKWKELGRYVKKGEKERNSGPPPFPAGAGRTRRTLPRQTVVAARWPRARVAPST